MFIVLVPAPACSPLPAPFIWTSRVLRTLSVDHLGSVTSPGALYNRPILQHMSTIVTQSVVFCECRPTAEMPEGEPSSRAAALPPASRPGTGAAHMPLAALSNGQGPLGLRGHRSDSLTESVADDASSMFSVSSTMDAIVSRSDSGLSALWQDDEFWQVGRDQRGCWRLGATGLLSAVQQTQMQWEDVLTHSLHEVCCLAILPLPNGRTIEDDI